MIKGIGIDITDVQRFTKVTHDTEILSELFTDGEIRKVTGGPGRLHVLARMFATKEATLKAVGRGLHFGSVWKDMDATADLTLQGHTPGKPPAGMEIDGKLHVCRSSSKNHSIAAVLIEYSAKGAKP